MSCFKPTIAFTTLGSENAIVRRTPLALAYGWVIRLNVYNRKVERTGPIKPSRGKPPERRVIITKMARGSTISEGQT